MCNVFVFSQKRLGNANVQYFNSMWGKTYKFKVNWLFKNEKKTWKQKLCLGIEFFTFFKFLQTSFCAHFKINLLSFFNNETFFFPKNKTSSQKTILPKKWIVKRHHLLFCKRIFAQQKRIEFGHMLKRFEDNSYWYDFWSSENDCLWKK